MKLDWIEWVGRGMQLALVVLVVGGLYGWAQQQSAKQDELCDVALSYAELLDANAMAAAAGVSAERYDELEYAVAMRGSEAQKEKWVDATAVLHDQIPTDVRRKIRHAEKVADEACAEPEYNDY